MAFLQNYKMRVLLVLVAIIIVVGGAIILWHHETHKQSLAGTALVSGAPAIQSIPAAGNPPPSYVKAQQQQNVELARQARRQATSAVPTITRPEFIGNLSEFQTPSGTFQTCPAGPGGNIPQQPGVCDVKNLVLARQAGVRAQELSCQNCACTNLKSAGFNATELKNSGFTAKQLRDCGFTLDELIAAGFTAAQLKDAGFTAADLKAAGFTAAQLKDAGFTADDLKAAGFTDAQIQDAGATTTQAPFVPDPKKICSVDALKKARAAGISATEMKQKGCSAAALRAAGYTAAELRAAGFSAKELKDAGFSAKDLKDAGFSAADLKAAGYTAADAKDAGVSPDALLSAGYTKGDLVRGGFAPDEAGYGTQKEGSCSIAALKQDKTQGVSATTLRAEGCGLEALKAAGYTAADLKAAGFTAAQLKVAGLTGADLVAAGFDPSQTPGINLPAASDSSASAAIPSISDNSPTDRLARIQKLQALQASRQQRENMLAQLQGQMNAQANQLLTQWNVPNVQQYMEGMLAVSGTSGNSGTDNSANAVTGPIYKAGSVWFAVLDTSINSDEQTPIMASIISGPLKGGKLIGQFSRVDQKLLINFKTLNDTSLPNTIPVNMVAIDPDTARTAIAGDVNNHYLLRYGSLFASSFLSGFASAVAQSGSTSTGGVFGTTTVYEQLNTTQQVMIGLGNVGTQYASQMGTNFSTPPTVKVPAGTGIGLLLMGDLTMSASNATQPASATASAQTSTNST